PPQPVYGQPPQPVHTDATPQPAAGFASVFDRAVALRPAAAAPSAPQPTTGLAMPALPMPVRKGRSASIWLFGILGYALLALIAYFAVFLGMAASLVGLVLAVVPLAIVLFGERLVDRLELEPKSLVVFALACCAVAAAGVVLLFDLLRTMTAGM